jgi:hypothetical protein
MRAPAGAPQDAVARVPLHGAPGQAVEQDRGAEVGRHGGEPGDDGLGVVVAQVRALRAGDRDAFARQRQCEVADAVGAQ